MHLNTALEDSSSKSLLLGARPLVWRSWGSLELLSSHLTVAHWISICVDSLVRS